MAFSSPLSLPLLLLLLLATTVTIPTAKSSSAASSSRNVTIYDILPLYGLPPGIFPDTVTTFSLSEDGALSVNLSGPCFVDFDWHLYYAPTITGSLRYGSLTGLSGIQGRDPTVWFLWLSVNSIWVDQPPRGYIHLNLGWVIWGLTIDDFFTVHSCNFHLSRKSAIIRQAIQWTKDLFTNLSW